MDREDCYHFVKAIAGVQELDLHNYRITGLFERYCHILKNDLLLTEEFLNFYES
jgi:hypothetical protein